jgi:hypothetical protein
VNGEKDPDFLDQFRDLERRIRILENTPRIPQVSTSPRGPQGATSTSVVDVLPGMTETYTSFVGAVSVTVTVPPSGQVTVFLADDATCESASSFHGWYAAPALSGANVVAASDSYALRHFASGGRRSIFFAQISGLQSGETTFTLQRRHTGVAPTVSAVFSMQTLLVLPF